MFDLWLSGSLPLSEEHNWVVNKDYLQLPRVWRNIVPLSLGNSPRGDLGLFPEGEGTVLLCSSRNDFGWMS
jgi:hypothetical protein